MNVLEINKIINTLNSNVTENKLLTTFKLIETLIEQNNLYSFNEQKNKLFDIYKNILKYSFIGVDDPERDKIYFNLKKSVIKLSNSIKHKLVINNKYFVTFRIKKEADIDFNTERNVIESEILNNSKENKLSVFFNKIWLSDIILEKDYKFIQKITSDENVSWHSQSIIVSAISISLFRNFDSRKMELLFNFYEKKVENVWHRALVGIILGIYLYSDVIKYYPEINERINNIIEEDDFKKNFNHIITQILKTKETEKISKKLQDEIIPKVAKFKPKIEDKLRLDDILDDKLSDDINPDWEEVFSDSPELLEKLEEFSKMQIEGSDVFMSAFSMLKNFDFFKEAYNWFVPFYKENKVVENSFETEKKDFNSNLFAEGLEKSAFLCNSDKYSFILNVKLMPEAQKTMMLEMFNAEIESMNELIKDDELLNKSMKSKYIFTQYIQDLYRFFKLNDNKNEFIDIFDDKLDFYNKTYFANDLFSIELFKQIGEFYFNKEYFSDALNVYKIIFEKGIKEQDIIEKIAFSYQKLKDYNKALEFYTKAELFETNINWTTKKIALCYRELNNNEKAVEYYLKAEKNEPENLYVQAHLGHVYLRLKNYEKALQHYFKVEYFAPSNTLILRPIAWCSFVLGKFDNSLKYYRKLIEKNEANHFDYIIMGHVEWLTNNVKMAVEYYKRGLKGFKNKFEVFRKEFIEDKEFIINLGIDSFEIELMLDYIALEDYSI